MRQGRKIPEWVYRYHFKTPIVVKVRKHGEKPYEERFLCVDSPLDHTVDHHQNRGIRLNVPQGSNRPTFIPWSNISHVETFEKDEL